jgi:hypothetical protein
MVTRRLTGVTRYRPLYRPFNRPVFVLEVEEQVKRVIVSGYLDYESNVYQWRDASAEDFEELNNLHGNQKGVIIDAYA